MTRQRVVVATHNPGKVAEIAAIWADPDLELSSLAELPRVVLPAEGGDYTANAIAKARAAATQLAGRVEYAVADDSGLEVDALNGAPGPYSARFGGAGLDDAGRLRALLEKLSGVEAASRGARFVCIAALATASGVVITRRGECRGRLLLAPRGEAGFGYDPIFQPEGSPRTMAELSPAEKNRISHRARAFTSLRAALKSGAAENRA